MKHSILFFVVLGLFTTYKCNAQTDSLITLSSLLDEMVSVESDVCFPTSNYSAKQLTSYDRRSLTPGTPLWHANDDWSGFVRFETNNGRREKVLFDEAGPGVITRIITTGGSGIANLRIYFDDEPEASILINGYDISKFPIAIPAGMIYRHEHYPTSQGSSFYYPIPYAKRCKITVDDINRNAYVYHINYRAYKAGTKVRTFNLDDAKALQTKTAEVGSKLQHPVAYSEGEVTMSKQLGSGETMSLDLPTESKAIRTLTFNISGYEKANYEQLMRGLIVKLTFDEIQTVWVPLSDFSGAGMGAPKVESYYLSADGTGNVTLRFAMPYKHHAKVELENITKFSATAKVKVNLSDWTWNANTLYFHATWRQERSLKTNVGLDYNMATLSGRGVFKGDMLSLYNYCPRWYGEGDEHIWVDNDTFPSHFGCGTEDYYNTTYAPIHIYFNPFGGAPREDYENSYGFNTFVRTRNLDIIPFNNQLKFEFELISWDGGLVDYASTAYWYGDLNSSAVNPSSNDEALQPLPIKHMKIEAESGIVGGGAVKANYSSASGGLQVGMLDNVGAYFQVNATIASAGTKKITIIYANGMSDTRHKSLYINGTKVGQLVFIPTGGWSNYNTLDINVDLREGTNTIKIQRDSEDDTATDFDYIAIPNEVKSATAIIKTSENEINLYPNPAQNSLSISVKNLCNLELTDLSGKLLLSEKMADKTMELDISNYPNGIFILKAINTKGEFFVQKIVKN